MELSILIVFSLMFVVIGLIVFKHVCFIGLIVFKHVFYWLGCV